MPQIQYESHSVGGTITNSEIQNLLLNGRNFLEMAKLKPAVQPPMRTSGNRTVVPILGAPGGPSGSGTRVTVDRVMMRPPQAGLTIGQSTTTLYPARRFHWNDSMTWQRGTHRARFGVDWEHNRGGALTWNNEPATRTLFSPDQVRTFQPVANESGSADPNAGRL